MIYPVMAQVHFTAQASTLKMGKGDYVEVQFVIENAKEIENFQVPDFPDFTIVEGPNQNSGMSILNGAMTQYRGVSFVLQPKKTGVLNVGPASAKVDGELLHSNSLRITVSNQSGGGNAKPPQFNPLPDPSWPVAQPPIDMDEVVRPGENIDEKIKKNFFLRVNLSKTDCYVGEPIVATYKLYARLRSDSRVTRHPSLNGFSVYDMIDPSEDRVTKEKVNGKNFAVHIIRKTQLIPLQAGDITLDPVELDNNIYLIKTDAKTSGNSGQGLGGILDRLFDTEPAGTPFTQHVVLESKPLVVHVKALPETGKPVDFNGAVGKYSIIASIDSKEVDTGDAALLSVTVKGSGNLPIINAPVISWPDDIESYDMSSKENILKATAPLSGSKTFTYSFIAKKTGNYILPPVKLSYFDLGSKTYKTVESEPLQIRVNRSGKKKSTPLVHTPVNIVRNEWTKYIWWSAGLLMLVVLILNFRKQMKRESLIKEEQAKRIAAIEKAKRLDPVADPLQESRSLMNAGDYGKFYAALNRAIWKSVSDKLQLPSSELNKLNIAAGLRTKGWLDEEIIQLKNVLNECEMKLYTPEFSTIDMERVLLAAGEITDRLKA